MKSVGAGNLVLGRNQRPGNGLHAPGRYQRPPRHKKPAGGKCHALHTMPAEVCP